MDQNEENKQPRVLSGDEAVTSTPNGRPRSLSRSTLEAVRQRDPEALSELFEAHFQRIYSLVYRLLGEKTSAEDAAQEVFLRVYRAADQIDPDRDPGPWLTTIAYNVCRGLWRSRAYRMGRRTRSLDEDAALQARLVDGTPGPAADRIRSERERLLSDALGQLPEEYRAVVVLHAYQGMTHEEVAKVLGASHAAVRKRHSRAMAMLREKLQGDWV